MSCGRSSCRHATAAPATPRRHVRHALLRAALVLTTVAACAPGDRVEDRAGEPAAPPTAAAPSAPAMDGGASIAGARVRGGIPGLTVEVVSASAWRDWMPHLGDSGRGPDGGSPLHAAIGLRLLNASDAVIAVDRTARLGATGGPLTPQVLDDLARAASWPLRIEPGAERRLQLGTRQGPFLTVGRGIDLEIELTGETGDRVQIEIHALPVSRTD